MNTIKVNKKELISKLKINRTQHQKDFIQSIRDFRIKAKADLKSAIEKVKASNHSVSLDKPETGINVNLVAPRHYLNDYDRAIEMLEMDVSEIVEITAQEFSRYVKDQWEWKDMFSQTMSSYNSFANEFVLPKKGGKK